MNRKGNDENGKDADPKAPRSTLQDATFSDGPHTDVDEGSPGR